MTSTFFRFPHTPHLKWLGKGLPRDDKILSEAEAKALLTGNVVVEEKLDGANLGFSLGGDGEVQAQNRGQYVTPPYVGQFSKLSQWRGRHIDALSQLLEPDWIVFGEWCAARHSIIYERLPDWWLLFDIYDRRDGEFRSTTVRNEFASKAGVAVVAEIFRGRTTLPALQELLMESGSRYGSGPIEGLIVRSESPNALRIRAKLVRPDFTQSIEEHWRSRRIEWNRVASVDF